jgi:hypothetical protein
MAKRPLGLGVRKKKGGAGAMSDGSLSAGVFKISNLGVV